MTTFFVSRHPGAIEWVKQQGVKIDRWVPHLDITDIASGDTVVGTLPVPMVFAVNQRGAHYLHLQVNVPASLRGVELTAAQLHAVQASLVAFQVQKPAEA